MGFFEVSAKTGLNIDKAMDKFAKDVVNSVSIKDLYMHLLFFFNEDFDDVLLHDVI